MCDQREDCPKTETSSGGEDEAGCSEGNLLSPTLLKKNYKKNDISHFIVVCSFFSCPGRTFLNSSRARTNK